MIEVEVKRDSERSLLKTLFACVLFLFILEGLIIPAGSACASESGQPVVVSLGDSYSSGEGVEPFYEQENLLGKFGEEDWLAHRSKKAWAGQLVINGTRLSDIKDRGWYFAAARLG